MLARYQQKLGFATARTDLPRGFGPLLRPDAWRRRLQIGRRPPGPDGLPVFGNMLSMIESPPEFLGKVRDEHGPYALIFVGPYPIYLIHDPSLIEELLVGSYRDVVKDAITRDLALFLGNGLLTSEGSFWKRQRRLTAPTLQRRQIETYADTMVERTRALTQRLVDGETRDLHDDMMHVTLEIVVETLFATSLQADARRIGSAIETLLLQYQRTLQSWRRLLPPWVPTRGWYQFRQAVEEIDSVVFRMIRGRRERGEEGDDLLGRLLRARDDEGEGMTDQQLRDELITIFVAGHETTALALSWSLYLLSENPAIRERLEQEVDSVVGERAATASDVSSLRLAEAVVKESMRLYPPAWVIGREATEPMELGDYEIPEQGQLIICQWVLHRDKRYFDNPERFDPDRWLDGRTDDLPRYAYLPFGAGPRICVGNHFAMMEAILVLATLVRDARFDLEPGHPVEPLPSITLRPKHGLRMRVSRG